MNRRNLVLIVLAVVAAHLGGFWALSDLKPLPKRRPIPQPAFIAKEKTFIDEETGEKLRVREFRISTRLADPRPQ